MYSTCVCVLLIMLVSCLPAVCTHTHYLTAKERDKPKQVSSRPCRSCVCVHVHVCVCMHVYDPPLVHIPTYIVYTCTCSMYNVCYMYNHARVVVHVLINSMGLNAHNLVHCMLKISAHSQCQASSAALWWPGMSMLHVMGT